MRHKTLNKINSIKAALNPKGSGLLASLFRSSTLTADSKAIIVDRILKGSVSTDQPQFEDILNSEIIGDLMKLKHFFSGGTDVEKALIRKVADFELMTLLHESIKTEELVDIEPSEAEKIVLQELILPDDVCSWLIQHKNKFYDIYLSGDVSSLKELVSLSGSIRENLGTYFAWEGSEEMILKFILLSRISLKRLLTLFESKDIYWICRGGEKFNKLYISYDKDANNVLEALTKSEPALRQLLFTLKWSANPADFNCFSESQWLTSNSSRLLEICGEYHFRLRLKEFILTEESSRDSLLSQPNNFFRIASHKKATLLDCASMSKEGMEWVCSHEQQVLNSTWSLKLIAAIPREYRESVIRSACSHKLLKREENIVDVRQAFQDGNNATSLANRLFGTTSVVNKRILSKRKRLPWLQLNAVSQDDDNFEYALMHAQAFSQLTEACGHFADEKKQQLTLTYVFSSQEIRDFMLTHAREVAWVLKHTKMSLQAFYELDNDSKQWCLDHASHFAHLFKNRPVNWPLEKFLKLSPNEKDLLCSSLASLEDYDHIQEKHPNWLSSYLPELQELYRTEHGGKYFRFPLKELCKASEQQYKWITQHQEMFLAKRYKECFLTFQNILREEAWPWRSYLYENHHLLTGTPISTIIARLNSNIYQSKIACRRSTYLTWTFLAVASALLGVAGTSIGVCIARGALIFPAIAGLGVPALILFSFLGGMLATMGFSIAASFSHDSMLFAKRVPKDAPLAGDEVVEATRADIGSDAGKSKTDDPAVVKEASLVTQP